MRPFAKAWILYALCVVALLGSVAWLTRSALVAERREAEAKGLADLQEKLRLATWRMDSTMALFLGPESARPHQHFEPTRWGSGPSRSAEARGASSAVPSALNTLDDPLVRLRFQMEGDALTSPSVPGSRSPGQSRTPSPDSLTVARAKERLAELRGTLDPKAIREGMRREGGHLLSHEEIQGLRRRASAGVASGIARTPRLSPYHIYLGRWIPFWHGDQLFLARQVWVGSRELLQGCWMEWNDLREVLLSTIRDTLPRAELMPAGVQVPGRMAGRLASLPVLCDPGPSPRPKDSLPLSTRKALFLAWSLSLIGTLVGGIVLYRTTRLSERRGAIASAVTHELRTPLTTFRLYTELLAKGMVPEESDRQALLETLLSEAERLDHIVNNVLAFARLEIHRGPNLELQTLSELVERRLHRLGERARQGGLNLAREATVGSGEALVRTDPLVVEQILLNLVDNAVKYAADAADRTLHLETRTQQGRGCILLRDHGPGISPGDRGKLFRPFTKLGSAKAKTAPGLGLGLSICRRMARRLGGDLVLDPQESGGATFVLWLPLEEQG